MKARKCRTVGCSRVAAEESLDCVQCAAELERAIHERERRMRGTPEDDGPDDANDPATWPEGMGRLGWRR